MNSYIGGSFAEKCLRNAVLSSEYRCCFLRGKSVTPWGAAVKVRNAWDDICNPITPSWLDLWLIMVMKLPLPYVRSILDIKVFVFRLLVLFVPRFWGAFANYENRLLSSVMSIGPSVGLCAWNNSSSTGRTFMKFDICGFFENLSRRFKFRQIWQE